MKVEMIIEELGKIEIYTQAIDEQLKALGPEACEKAIVPQHMLFDIAGMLQEYKGMLLKTEVKM